ncbi:MAG: hypothetical protein IKI02_04860 [Oscillospiraceae bacterium]|nr:hypothetical protein [Oscillospiraceae bacterium]
MNTETILLACVGLCFPQAGPRSDEASETRHQASDTTASVSEKRTNSSHKRFHSLADPFRTGYKAKDKTASGRCLMPVACCLMPFLAGILLKGTD